MSENKETLEECICDQVVSDYFTPNIKAEVIHGKYSEQYLHDMKICQEFADENRKMIAKLILEHYGMEPLGSFTTAHNYIDCDANVIRKGAVSAKKGERILIPLNMRDGSLICVG